ncbi:unnamed protein product [Rotaria socialis]|uniref:Uncharacterized protein n=1 Tax=Rotaria socialis TaxID=392032 RepID=A0A821TC20_9BILA|nr:unnamed protein product [Rotaria socialis]
MRGAKFAARKSIEKLVDCINETRIYTEELSRSLFREEDKSIYDKITKCLLNLKNAQRVENYRARAYSDIIKDIEQQLIQHIKELEKSVVKSNLDLDNFTKIFDVSKILIEIDEMRCFESFIPILKQYIDEFNLKFQGIINYVSIIIIDRYNLDKSSEPVYKTLDYYTAEKALFYLDACLNQLKEGTSRLTLVLTHHLEKEQIKLIVENLKRLEKAKFVIEKHLNISHAIDEFIEEMKTSIETKIKYFSDRIGALMINYNFSEADEKIDSLIVVRNLLGKYCIKDISDQIENLQNYGKTVVLSDMINRYSKMDISEYMLNPPKNIFEKLPNVNSTNQIYSEVLDKSRKLILEKIRNELERAKTKQTIDITNEHIRRFESAVKYLPESMKNALEIELQHCKGDIKRLIQYSELNLKHSSITEEIDKLNNCSFEYQNLQLIKSDFKKGKELASKRIVNIVVKIQHNLEKQNIIEALNINTKQN